MTTKNVNHFAKYRLLEYRLSRDSCSFSCDAGRTFCNFIVFYFVPIELKVFNLDENIFVMDKTYTYFH